MTKRVRRGSGRGARPTNRSKMGLGGGAQVLQVKNASRCPQGTKAAGHREAGGPRGRRGEISRASPDGRGGLHPWCARASVDKRPWRQACGNCYAALVGSSCLGRWRVAAVPNEVLDIRWVREAAALSSFAGTT
jgi:hypothetical protein